MSSTKRCLLLDEYESAIRSAITGAGIAHQQGDSEQAELMYRKALRIAELRYGAMSGDVALILLYLVDLYKACGREADSGTDQLEKRIFEILQIYAIDIES